MSMSNSNRWKNIQHLEIAVSCIRSLMFFSCHKDDCWPIYSEDEFVNRKYEKFILELSYVLDDYCTMENKKKNRIKRMLCTMCPSIQKVYYERDKNVAHKDRNYKKMPFQNLEERIAIMSKIIDDICNICAKALSDKYRVIFFPYDDNLRFCVYQITKDMISKYYQTVARLSIGQWSFFLHEKMGISIIIPGDVCEITTKMALFEIQKNIDNDTDIWDNVYEDMRKPYEEFYTQILPKIKNALS